LALEAFKGDVLLRGAGNLLKVTEGRHTGKLALLDFGLVAEIPEEDRCVTRSLTPKP
jgi:predicted unusual protein kinase regulating ubiquinone biosynthesis (AarF/ABC1/UbiB family)